MAGNGQWCVWSLSPVWMLLLRTFLVLIGWVMYFFDGGVLGGVVV